MAKDYGVWVDIWWLLNWPQSNDPFPQELQTQYQRLRLDALNERIEQSLKGLNETAQRVQNLWLSFLGVSLFFAIATSNTTHEMLFYRRGQALPFFDKITINLDGFAIVGPILYIVLHAYLLTMLIALARTAVPFESAMRALRARGPAPVDAQEGPDEHRHRSRVTDAIFAQLLVGPLKERQGTNAWLFWAIALFTVAIMPLAVLFLFLLMFLPYQSDTITWLHRFFVWVDLALIAILWTSYRRRWGSRLWPIPSMASQAALASCVLFMTFAASFPCRVSDGDKDGPFSYPRCATRWDDWLRWPNRLIDYGVAQKEGKGQLLKFEQDRVAYGPYTVLGWFPNRLELPNQLLINQDLVLRLQKAREGVAKHRAKIGINEATNPSVGGASSSDANRYSLDLRERTFRAANLSLADMSLADLSGADLTSSELQDVWLPGARLDEAQFQSARLSGANLKGASLTLTQLPDALLNEAQLHGASMDLVQLPGATLREARLYGASLFLANLRGADLFKTQLQGAYLANANLQGASLVGARLSGAEMSKANISWAKIIEADMRGIRAGDLGSQADFFGAFVSSTNIWRASGAKNSLNSTIIFDLHYESGVFDDPSDSNKSISYKEWSDKLLAETPEGSLKNEMAERLKRLDPSFEKGGDGNLLQANRANSTKDFVMGGGKNFTNERNTEEFDAFLKRMCSPEDWGYAKARLMDQDVERPSMSVAVVVLEYWRGFSAERRNIMISRIKEGVIAKKEEVFEEESTNSRSGCEGALGLPVPEFAKIVEEKEKADRFGVPAP